MSTLFIQDTTLTAIANAIRTKTGNTPEPLVIVNKSSNVNTPEDYTPGAPSNGSASGGGDYFPIKIDGAAEIEVKFWYEFNAPAASMFQLKSGYYETKTWKYAEADYTRNNSTNGTIMYEIFLLKNTDAVSVYVLNAGTRADSFGWYFEVRGYDANGNPVGASTFAATTYTPLEMPAAILSISGEGGGGITPEGNLDIVQNGDYDVTTYASAHVAVPVGIFPQGTLDIRQNGNYDCADYQNVYVDVPSSGGVEIDPVVLTGGCESACSGAMATAFIQNFPNKVSTKSITGATQMFYQTPLEEIPFDLNFNPNAAIVAQNIFSGAQSLKKVPKFNNMQPRNLQNMFRDCMQLREIPEDWCDTWNWYTLHSTTQGNCVSMFNYCLKLRRVPEKVLKELYASCTASYYSQFNGTFNRCQNLDEIRGLNFDGDKALTSNMFVSSPFEYLYCLKHFTFATNEDGTPKTANWKNQTIDLSYYVGYMTAYSLSETESVIKNAGRTTDKCIYNQETYRALKNDPDAYVWGDSRSDAPWEYALYNRAAAVETINSLPDCSASGGTNTIRFFGVQGSATDEGAINTMTEAEIAVAAAKGWTVTYKV